MERTTPPDVKSGVSELINNIQSVISIHERKLEYLVASHIAGGHVLLADSHGVGKTSLARALAGSIRWSDTDGRHADVPMDDFNRVQCTVDLLPQDILGYNRIVGTGSELYFNKGPIFSHFVLCDEINLLTPKTQGSFFQAMEEQEVSVEGRTYTLPDPFFIIATMNLRGAHLFPLPAPQLDRFMIQLSMGYPPFEDEESIVRRHGRDDSWPSFSPVVDSTDLLRWKAAVDEVFIHDDVISYIVACVRATREHPEVLVGASPRTGVKLSRLTRALVLTRGESFVSVDTVKEVFATAVTHRLVLKNAAQNPSDIVEEILSETPVEAPRRK